MAGGIERERPYGERTAQQTKPEQAPAHGGRELTSVQRDQQPHGGGVNRPEIDPPEEAPKVGEIRLPGGIIFFPQQTVENIDQDRIEAHRASVRGATFFSAVGLSEIIKKLKDQKDKQNHSG